jgi:hypothetical protein
MSVPVYAARGPVPFLFHYVGRRLGSHVVVLAAILAAVGCAIGSQYAVKNLVDVLGWQFPPASSLWTAVAILLTLVAGDNRLRSRAKQRAILNLEACDEAIAHLVAVALVATLASTDAYALSNRTFVSGNGSDSNPCSIAAPEFPFDQLLFSKDEERPLSHP